MKQIDTTRRTKALFVPGFLFAMFLTTNVWAQTRQVTGVITDATDPLPGASVTVKGTNTGTISGVDGSFTIQAGPDATLVVSFIGYRTLEVGLNNRTIVNIVLQEDVAGLDEVVVIGYGTVRKRDLTGSVSSVKSEVVMAAPSINAITSLGGRIAGLDIAENVDPRETTIRIRGNRSISGTNEPLFIIDGVQGGSYSDINPNDIESIEALKDASSTAIYGYQGANGVIIITTKKGEAGKMAISYNGFAGVEYLPQHPDYRKGDSWLNARREAYRTTGSWNSSSDDRVLFGTNVAWEAYQNNQWINFDDLTMQDSFFNSHNVTATGGNDRTTARMSVGYYGNKSHYKKGKSERYTLRANIDHKVHDWITAGMVTQLTHNVRHNSPYEGLSAGGGIRVGSGVELGQAYDESGNVIRYPLGESEYINPLVNGTYTYSKANESQGTNVMANGFINLTPVAGLSLRTGLSANFEFQRVGTYSDRITTDRQQAGVSSSSLTNTNTRFLNWDNVATYQKTIGDHSFGVTGLTSWVKSIKETLAGSGTDQIVGSQLWWALQSNATIGATSDYVQYQSFSYAGRFNYSYRERYLLTGSMRWDGASRLSDKWDSFPSLALGWRISEEEFMKPLTFLDNLKLRVSYGTTGNSAINPYGTQNGVVSFNNSGLAFRDSPVLWYVFKQTLGNVNLGWEKTSQIDAGLDISVLGGRLSATIDYYDSKTSDLLLLRTLPNMMGQGVPTDKGRTDLAVFSMYQNIGKTRNRGLEVEINSLNISNRDFTWNTTLTFTANKEKITGLIDGEDILHSQYPYSKSLLLGRPINSYRGYALSGIWQTSEAAGAAAYFQDAGKTIPFEPGLIKVKDLNGDNIIDAEDENGYLGSQSPEWFAGLNNTFSYKNFDLSIYAFLRWGHWGENPLSDYDPKTGGRYTTFNYWTPEKETNDFPRPNANLEFYQYHGYLAYSYVDRSFFRIKNITLGYTFPKQMAGKTGLKKLRLYATGSNLWFKNKSKFMKDFDPEGLRRQIVFGVNVEF
ncbi:MAG: TonB-dependent receptor [Mediterranea sp.]|jgi:TonB-linked SusC/RagA family outer membrane protein|nr:TonB-dependent receptor [Mediterranea sp.]